MISLILKLNLLLFVTFFIIVENVSADKYNFVTFQFPPLEFANNENKAEGMAVDVVRKIMQDLGHEVNIEVYPWTRALKMVRMGNADAIFTAYKNIEREQFLVYSKQVLLYQAVYFYKRSDSDVTFNGSFQSLKFYKIGVVSTISYGQIFDRARPNLIIDKARRLEHNFKKLIMNRIDLVPSNNYVADYILRQLNLSDNIVQIPHRIESVPSYIAFTKKRHLLTLRDQFDLQLKNMKESGEYLAIIEKYGVSLPNSR